MNLTSKTKISHYLLSNTFDDNFSRYHLDILNLSIQHNNRGHYEEKTKFKQHFWCYF